MSHRFLFVPVNALEVLWPTDSLDVDSMPASVVAHVGTRERAGRKFPPRFRSRHGSALRLLGGHRAIEWIAVGRKVDRPRHRLTLQISVRYLDVTTDVVVVEAVLNPELDRIANALISAQVTVRSEHLHAVAARGAGRLTRDGEWIRIAPCLGDRPREIVLDAGELFFTESRGKRRLTRPRGVLGGSLQRRNALFGQRGRRARR